MDWAGFRFQDPGWLWTALLGPLVLAIAWWRERHGQAVVFPGASRLKGKPAGLRVWLRHAPVVSAALGLIAASAALARPQHGTLKEQVTTRGVDIVVALDVSGSMAAEDFQPRNRLAVAKEVVAEFVKRRPHDRIGLVAFAGKSLTKSPPTTDGAVLLRQLEDVRLEMLPDGTAIGAGLATSLTRLRRPQARSKRIADRTGGEFFRATDSASLRHIFDRIDQLEKSEIKLSAYRRYRELFFPVLAAAAGLLAMAGALWSAGLRVAPA